MKGSGNFDRPAECPLVYDKVIYVVGGQTGRRWSLLTERGIWKESFGRLGCLSDIDIYKETPTESALQRN